MKFPMGLILLSRLDDGSLPGFHFELGTSTINTIREVWSEDMCILGKTVLLQFWSTRLGLTQLSSTPLDSTQFLSIHIYLACPPECDWHSDFSLPNLPENHFKVIVFFSLPLVFSIWNSTAASIIEYRGQTARLIFRHLWPMWKQTFE